MHGVVRQMQQKRAVVIICDEAYGFGGKALGEVFTGRTVEQVGILVRSKVAPHGRTRCVDREALRFRAALSSSQMSLADVACHVASLR